MSAFALRGLPPTQEITPLALTPQEAAEMLNISLSTLARLTKQGRIPCVRLGRLVRYSDSVIRAVADGTDTTQNGGAA